MEEGGFTAAARRLHMVQSTVSSMVSALERDLGVTLFERTALTSQEEQGLASRLLWQEPMVLVTGRADPLPGDDPVPLSAVAGLPFVDFPQGWAVRREVDRAFRAAKVARGRRLEVNDLLSAADLVEFNLAVSILPGSLAARFLRLLARPIARHAPHWRVMLVHRHGGLPEPVRTFLNLLR